MGNKGAIIDSTKREWSISTFAKFLIVLEGIII